MIAVGSRARQVESESEEEWLWRCWRTISRRRKDPGLSLKRSSQPPEITSVCLIISSQPQGPEKRKYSRRPRLRRRRRRAAATMMIIDRKTGQCWLGKPRIDAGIVSLSFSVFFRQRRQWTLCFLVRLGRNKSPAPCVKIELGVRTLDGWIDTAGSRDNCVVFFGCGWRWPTHPIGQDPAPLKKHNEAERAICARDSASLFFRSAVLIYSVNCGVVCKV